MSRVPKLRVNLRMFLLLCIGASFIVAWLGLEYRRADIESQWGGGGYTSKPFGTSGFLLVYNDRDVVEATVQAADDLAGLKAAPNVDCSEIEDLRLCSPETLRAFRPDDWPNLKSVLLVDCAPTAGSLSRFGGLPKLHTVGVYEAKTDPSGAFGDFADIPLLMHLTLDVKPGVSLDSFPQLEQLQTLHLASSDVEPEQIAVIQKRLPNCSVTTKE